MMPVVLERKSMRKGVIKNTDSRSQKMKEDKNEKDVPFFARYLEDQDFPRVQTNVKAGLTLKYPSDRDEID